MMSARTSSAENGFEETALLPRWPAPGLAQPWALSIIALAKISMLP